MLSTVSDVLLAYRKSRELYDPEHKSHGSDRRVFHRVQMAVDCQLANPAFGLEARGTTINVSLDGLGATAPVNWSEGNQIRVKLGALPFQIDGVIVFRKEERPTFRYGVQFQNLSVFQILKLRRFLKQYYNGFLSL